MLIATVTALCTVFSCGCSQQKTETEAPEQTDAVQITEQVTEAAVTTAENNAVASPDEMAEPSDIIREGMVPVHAEDISDGVYDVTVDSSSSMFNIVSCSLEVADGKMNAVMTMGGKGYLYVFMGTGEEAVKADSSEYIPFEENENGEHTFTVPVSALDEGINCTAFSKNKEKWYDRTIVFRADSLPSDAFSDGFFVTAESLGLADGTYTAEVKLSGGSGRASVSSPAEITVKDGKASAVIEWSSSNYDYMVVGEEKILPSNTEGNSVFEIPVTAFDSNMPVKADTTAMSTPHEIEYTLFFDSSTITEK